MANKISPNSIGDEIRNFVGTIILALFAIAFVLYLIFKFITEILIPFLIGLFVVTVATVLIITLARLLVHLIAYLTLGKRYRRKIASRSKQINEVDATELSWQQREPPETIDRRHASKVYPQRYVITRAKLVRERQNAATALADHLANALDTVNGSRRKLSGKVAVGVSDKLSQKLAKQDRKAALLNSKINRLSRRYDIEPDPAFERKERMYPMISGFDRFVSASLKRCWARVTQS